MLFLFLHILKYLLIKKGGFQKAYASTLQGLHRTLRFRH